MVEKSFKISSIANGASVITSLDGEPLVIEGGKQNRTIFDAKLVTEHSEIEGATISGTLIKQKKGPDGWSKIDGDDLTTMKVGDIRSLKIGREGWKTLYDILADIYGKKWEDVGVGEKKMIIADGEDDVITIPKSHKNRIELYKKIIESDEYAQEVWNQMLLSKGDLTKKLSYAQVQEDRESILSQYETGMIEYSDIESYWQKLFEENERIFGYGLSYQFLHKLKSQPNYGGVNYTRSGEQKGDFLNHTGGNSVKYTVLVEIKTPGTPLFKKDAGSHARNGTWTFTEEFLCAISQIQVNCETRNVSSDSSNNTRELDPQGIYTHKPKGILVIGNTDELDVREKRETFEVMRRNLHNPEVITFDELLGRVKHIVAKDTVNQTEITENDPFPDIINDIF